MDSMGVCALFNSQNINSIINTINIKGNIDIRNHDIVNAVIATELFILK